MGDGAIVLGNIELDGRTLTLSVNSRSRAERGRVLLAAALSALVDEPVVEIQPLEEARAARPRGDAKARSSGLSPEEERAVIHETLDRHYAQMLDEAIPMLGDATPLEAAGTEEGRGKAAEWLKFLENHLARLPPEDPMADYDFAWLWNKLGVGDLRR